MIKFFRKIRYEHMEKGKTEKYLKYAIGEIILVVIGILIALQINNFNEQRKDRAKEQVILKNLMEDYQANLLQLKEKMAMRNKMIVSAFEILKAIDDPKSINRDILISHLAVVIDWPTFDPIQNDLISSGNLRLIRNEKLTRLLSNWSSDIVALQEIESAWASIVIRQFEPAVLKLGLSRDIANSWMNESDQLWLLDNIPNATSTTIGISKNPSSVRTIIESKDIEGLTSQVLTYNKPANIQSEALLKRINEIIDLIDKEIE